MEARQTLGEAEHHHLSDPGKEARAKSGVPVVPVFDGYRAFAILGVVALHLTTASGVAGVTDGGLFTQVVWATFGRSVEVLFVISGFVVFLPTVARGGDFGSLRSYVIRRGARLLPAYWLILAISLVLLATVNLDGQYPFPGTEAIVANFSGLEGPLSLVNADLPVGFGVNGPLWTLSLEISFYIVLPFIAVAFFRRPWIGLIIAAIVTIAWQAAFENVFDVAGFLNLGLSPADGNRLVSTSGFQLPAWALSFAMGMAGASLYVKLLENPLSPKMRRLLPAVIALLAAATAGSAFLLGGYFGDTRGSNLLAMCFTVSLGSLMIAIALGPESLQRPFANRRVRTLGDISYGIYLCHVLFMIYLGDALSLPQNGTVGDLAIWTIVILPVAILYGYLSARFIEQPIRRWARQFGRRAQQ